jgi:hypothetical protein
MRLLLAKLPPRSSSFLSLHFLLSTLLSKSLHFDLLIRMTKFIVFCIKSLAS